MSASSGHHTRSGGEHPARWVRALSVAAAVMLTSGVLALWGSGFIHARFPDRPQPRDLLFELLPHWPSWQVVVEVIYVAGAVLMGVYVFRHAVSRIPEIIAVYGLMEIGRALTMVLTPLAPPYD